MAFLSPIIIERSIISKLFPTLKALDKVFIFLSKFDVKSKKNSSLVNNINLLFQRRINNILIIKKLTNIFRKLIDFPKNLNSKAYLYNFHIVCKFYKKVILIN